MKTFNKEDLGCWVDGAYGTAHRQHRLAELIRPIKPALADELLMTEIDDFSVMEDLENEVMEVLAAYTSDGLEWVLEAGDIILTETVEQI